MQISQTFLIPAPENGIDAVFLTSVSVYFSSVSSDYGIQLEIRETDGGVPINKILPHASKVLAANQVSYSSDSSVPTVFTFDTPVLIRTNEKFAIAISPVANDPEYSLWSGYTGQFDILTNNKIYVDNQIGELYDSKSNLIPYQYLKYSLSVANFTSASGAISLKNANTDLLVIENSYGDLSLGERVSVSNSYFKGTGLVVNTGNSVMTTANSTTFSYLTGRVNNYIFIVPTTETEALCALVLSTNSSTNSIVLSVNSTFTDSNASVGQVRGDGNLLGYVSAITDEQPYSMVVIDGVTSNSTVNFANTSGSYLIGRDSGSFTEILTSVDSIYDSITPQINQIVPSQTNCNWSFVGTNLEKVVDSNNSVIQIDSPDEFIDYNRVLMSRSNEYQNFNSDGLGASSLRLTANVSTSNNLITPFIDLSRASATLTHNVVIPNDQNLSGYIVNLGNVSGNFYSGDAVYQTNATATTSGSIVSGNSTVLVISNVSSSNTGTFGYIAQGSILTDVTTGGTANAVSVRFYTETSDDATFVKSRYISKNVVLDEGQDAEDFVVYLTAYRPPGTSFAVYGKFLCNSDPDKLSDKDWSLLVEQTPNTLCSSLVNKNDYVDLSYGLPTSQLYYSSGVTVENTAISFNAGLSNLPFTPGEYVYFTDNNLVVANAVVVVGGSGYTNGDIGSITGTPGFSNASYVVSTNTSGGVVSVSITNGGSYTSNSSIVANTTANTTGSGSGLTLTVYANSFVSSNSFCISQVISTQNTSSFTTMTVSETPLYTNNAALGSISGVASPSGAFGFADNFGIVRYVTGNNAVHDSFISFAVKIVPISEQSNIVPKLNDMRCIALQI